MASRKGRKAKEAVPVVEEHTENEHVDTPAAEAPHHDDTLPPGAVPSPEARVTERAAHITPRVKPAGIATWFHKVR